MKKELIILLLGFLSFCYVQSQPLPQITFTPQWLPQAQFAGYYVAQNKGFYRSEGLAVRIVHPSVSVNAVESLINGQSDIISLFLTTALSFKDLGVDLVNMGQISQNSALLFVSKKEKHITKLSDLDGKKIGIWKSGFDEVAKALIRSHNYKVEWVPILSSVNLFLSGYLDAMTVMWYNEYDQIIQAGVNEDELNTFFFSDFGFNIPEDGLYCLNKTAIQRKEDLEKFVRASLKGWEYAKDHREETLEIVLEEMKRAHVPTNKAHQAWMLDKVLSMIEPGKKNVKKGALSESDFDKTQKILIEGGYMKKRVDFQEFYKSVNRK
ncbi:MAG: ABC transporter substrate-binding protein [Macellibacteroides fermentans]|uniref:ABC transporter substrate-binding protein n=1 Tax=Macellibacteroides fermentans TaxID=879969 RepID=UPI003B6BEA05